MIYVDNQVIDGVNRGDEQSFRQLFDLYWSYLCSVATMYVPDPDYVEEIVIVIEISPDSLQATASYCSRRSCATTLAR